MDLLLKSLIDEIEKIKVCKSNGKVALHKPILLLIILTEILNGKKDGVFLFSDYSEQIEGMLRQFGWMHVKSYTPNMPFFHLKTSQFWTLDAEASDQQNAPSKGWLKDNNIHGYFNTQSYNFLRNQPEHTWHLIKLILNKYWSETIHADILNYLNIQDSYYPMTANKPKRDRLFIEKILNVYMRKCAICGQSIRLGDDLLGLDACHVQPIQYNGPDKVENGICLCKLHHWALDRGAVTISSNNELKVSGQINGQEVDTFILRYNNKPIFNPESIESRLLPEFKTWHQENIFRV